MEAPQREQTEAATPEPTGNKRKRRSSDPDRLPRIPRLHPAVGQWLTDTYERSELDDGVPCAVLYDEYKRFCHSTGLRPVAHTILGKFLQQVFPGLGRVKRSCGGRRIPEYQLVLRRGCSSSDSDTDSSRDMEEEDEFEDIEYDGEEEDEETEKYLQNKLQLQQQGRKRRRAAIVHSIVETTHHTTTETTETEHYLKLDVCRRTHSSKENQRGRRFLEYKDFIGLGISDSMYCTLYNLGIEFSVCKIVECKKYLDAYAQIFWPMLPIPWIIVNGDVIENYSLMKDTEKDVMKLNIWVAIFVGAGLFGDQKVSEKLYYQAMDMIPFIHDSLDLNMVTSLIYMSSYAFMLFDLERGATIALNYILLAEATCIARNATNTEMYGKVLNLKFWLTRGESNLIMPEDKYPVTEEISSNSSLHLRTEVQRLVNIRHAFNSVMAHKMYLEKAISLVRVCKAQLAQNLPLPNGAFPNDVLLSYNNELKRLRRIGCEVLQQINGQVHPVAYELQVLNHNSTVSMTYSEMGNQKKAAKFATLCIDQLDRQGSMPYYFYLKECPRVLAQAGAWDQLARFIRIAQEYDRFQYVAFLRDSAKQLLAGALTSFPSHAIGNYSPKGQPIPTYCDEEETVQQNQIIEALA